MNNILLLLIILILIIIINKINNERFSESPANIKYVWSDTNKTSNYKEKILSENPKIVYIHNFLSENEVNHIIKLADQLKKPSTIDSKESPVTLKENVRSSNSAHLGKSRDDIVKNIEKKAAEYTKLNTNYIEPLQVVVYEKGQKYNPHYDFFSPDSNEIINIGNRTKTMLVYLNDLPDNAGGNTFFPKLNLKIKPKARDAIYFENMNDGELNYDTLHAGEEILNNSKKYAINIWFRENEINFAN